MITERKDFSVIDCGYCCGPHPSLNEVENRPPIHPCPECGGTKLIIISHKKKEPPTIDLKEEILNTIDASVSNFLYYDRKEDEDLPRGAIEKALKDGTITMDEITERFKELLEEGVKE